MAEVLGYLGGEAVLSLRIGHCDHKKGGRQGPRAKVTFLAWSCQVQQVRLITMAVSTIPPRTTSFLPSTTDEDAGRVLLLPSLHR
jgi:hypothetical protein